VRRANTITKFHKRAPRKLVQLYKEKEGNCYLVSQEIKVNPAQVWNLLKNGKEPKREDLRRKLFLSTKKTPVEREQARLERKRKQEALDQEIKEYFIHIMEVTNGKQD